MNLNYPKVPCLLLSRKFAYLTKEGDITMNGIRLDPKKTYDVIVSVNQVQRQTYRIKGNFSVSLSEIKAEDMVSVSIQNFSGPGQHLNKEYAMRHQVPYKLQKQDLKKVGFLASGLFMGYLFHAGQALSGFASSGALK